MPVSRARKKKIRSSRKQTSKKPKPYEVIKYGMYKYQSPFPEDLPFEKRLEIILKIGERSAEEFEADYSKITGYLNDYDPLYLLSFCVLYFLASPEGIDREAIEGKDGFPPFYIEVLQALVLVRDRNYSVLPLADKVQEFYELIQSFNQHQSYRYYLLGKDVKTEKELHSVTLRMEMMTHTLAVRNWAYEPQMHQVAYDLGELVQAEFLTKFGIEPRQLLEILFRSVDLTNDRLNDHLHKIRNVAKAKNYQEVFDRYVRCIGKTGQ
jgi:hypothetical protein